MVYEVTRRMSVYRRNLLVINQFVFFLCLRSIVATQHGASPPPRECVGLVSAVAQRSLRNLSGGLVVSRRS